MISNIVGDIFGQPSAPTPPDYAGAAQQQGQSNLDAAIATGIMNRPNQSNPYGTQTWTQSGSTDVNGRAIPNWTSNVNLSPVGQGLFDSFQKQQTQLASLGDTAMGAVQNTINSPLDLDKNRSALVDSYYKQQTRLMDPRYAQDEDNMRSDLVNRGFSVGNAGYTRATDNFQRNKDAAYQQAGDYANTQGAQQAIQEALIARNQPMQELNALRTGAMPQVPTFGAQTQAGQVAGAPVFAGAQAAGNAAVQNYGIQSGNYNNMMNGLASLGSAYMTPAA